MLKELVQFVEKNEAEIQAGIKSSDPARFQQTPVVIINTKIENGAIVTDGEATIKKISEISPSDFRRTVETAILRSRYGDPNKKIGSKVAFQSALHYCILVDPNVLVDGSKFVTKAKKHRDNDNTINEYGSLYSAWAADVFSFVQNSCIHVLSSPNILQELRKASSMLKPSEDGEVSTKKKGGKTTDNNVAVFVRLPTLHDILSSLKLPKDAEKNKEAGIYDVLFEIRKPNFLFNKISERVLGTCDICGKPEQMVGSPGFMNTYQSSKPFVTHITRSTSGKGVMACAECLEKFNNFQEFAKSKRIKIFPLFSSTDDQSKEIRIINQNQEGFNTFETVMGKFGGEDTHDFHLVVMPNFEIEYFDYIFNYKWKVGVFTEHSGKKYDVNRTGLEKKLFGAIGIHKDFYRRYFDDAPTGADEYLFNMFKDRIFSFVYRGKSLLTKTELSDFVIRALESRLRGSMSRGEEKGKNRIGANAAWEILDLWFNGNMIIMVDFMPISLEELRRTWKEELLGQKRALASGETADEKWAYACGKLYHELASHSKANDSEKGGEKPLQLEPIVNANTSDMLRLAIKTAIERYQHALNESDRAIFGAAVANVLVYVPSKSLREIKQYFYAGYFDDEVKQ